MGVVGGAVDGTGLFVAFRAPGSGDLHGGDERPLGVAKSERLAFVKVGRERIAHVEGHGDGPQRTTEKAHVAKDALVFGGADESLKRREGAVEQQLEVAELARREAPAPRVPGAMARFVAGGAGEVRVPERPGVGPRGRVGDSMVHRLISGWLATAAPAGAALRAGERA